MSFIKYIEDLILAAIQRRCDHPAQMVASDVLEGCAETLAVKYCRRCGAIKTDWRPSGGIIERNWRQPDPHLWRG